MPKDRERRSKRVYSKYDDDVSYYLIGNRDVEDEKEYEKEYLQYLRNKIMSEVEITTRFKRVRHVGMGYAEDDDNDDEHYQNMITELFERMRVKISLEDNLAFEDEVKKSKKSKRLMKTEKKQEQKEMKFSLEDNLAFEDEVKKSKKSKRPMIKTEKKQEQKEIVDNQVTQRLKRFITNEINGEEVKLVIQKKLYASDLYQNQNRLNMPKNQLEPGDFLTKEEKECLESGNGLKVQLLGPRLKFHNHHDQPMVLTIWNVGKNRNYVLKTNWYNFVMANKEDLKENTMIQVWSFRLEGRLCFAIACLD